MYPDELDHAPAVLPKYQPYLYQSGRFQTYGVLSWTPSSRTPFRSEAATYFSSPQLGRPWDRLFTVEQIIAHGYFSVPYALPETGLISDKLHTSRMGLEDLVSQIRGRTALYQKNMEELALAQCEADNAVFRQEADQGHPADARQRYSANKRIQDLYQEQREERVNLWKDVSRLRLAFPELTQSYLASYRKMSLLDDLSEEEPDGKGTGGGQE
jgi:hypothetical protein